MRASGVVKCQLALVVAALRSFSQAGDFLDQGLLFGKCADRGIGKQERRVRFGEIKPAAVLGGVVAIRSARPAAGPRQPERLRKSEALRGY